MEWAGDHHVTYVAKGGHAQYRAFETDSLDFPGSCDANSATDEAQGFADKCGQGTAWNTWESKFGGIVNVGEKARPLNDANWLRYSGLWPFRASRARLQALGTPDRVRYDHSIF